MSRRTLRAVARAFAVAALASLAADAALAQQAAPPATAPAAVALTRTQTFELPVFAFQNGRRLARLTIGYETHGRLNATGDNVIFIPRSYSANSRVAARVAPTDPAPAIWDGLIGPGRLFDTDRFFIVASSNLAALPTGDPNTVTTGPASINPQTGRPYGADFPVYTIRDMVEIDRALLAHLGVRRVHTMFGVSMGSMQAFEWSVAHPDFVERVIALLPIAEADGFTVAWMNAWAAPILSDPNWNGGNYHGGAAPIAGMVQALNIIHLHQRNREFGMREARAPADPARSPGVSLDNGFRVDALVETASRARARVFDAASIVLGARAMALFSVGGKATLDEGFAPARARFLVIPAKSDILFFPAYGERARDALRRLGREVDYMEIDGEGGHFDGVFKLSQAMDAMRRFVQR